MTSVDLPHSVPTVLVTRPTEQAGPWVTRLGAAGVPAAALPLMAIAAAEDLAPLKQAWQDLTLYRLLVFVSPNAVLQFFAQRPPDSAPWPTDVLVATVGPGSSQALRAAGVPAAQVLEPAATAENFDSEALWLQLQTREWHGRRVLLVRGDGGREWLGDRLRERGAQVSAVQAYRRVLPRWHATELALLSQALDAPANHAWLLSSSEAIDNLSVLAPDRDLSRSMALATHPRIAERARQQGFARVVLTRPDVAAVAAAAQGLA